MSYILDALRKADRERRLREVAPLESSVTGESSEKRQPHWVRWLIVALVVINTVTVSYLLLKRDNPSTPPSTTDPAQIPEKTTALSIPRTLTQAHAPERAPARRHAATDDRSGNGTTQISIADMLAKKQTPDEEEHAPPSPPSPRIKRPPVKPQPIAEPAAPRPAPRPKARARERENTGVARAALIQPRKDDTVKTNAADSIPYLQDLPRDVQRRVPSLMINVYVSSDNPEERFIVANMTKYRPGQQIADGLTLEEIEPASMILRFEGKRFRMRRP